AAAVVDQFDLAGLRVDALDLAAKIIFWRHRPGYPLTADLEPAKAAIVADIDLAVGPHRRAVRPALHLGDSFLAAIRVNPGQPLPHDLDQDDRAVGHDDRTFGKFETVGDDAHLGHFVFSLSISYPSALVG